MTVAHGASRPVFLSQTRRLRRALKGIDVPICAPARLFASRMLSLWNVQGSNSALLMDKEWTGCAIWLERGREPKNRLNIVRADCGDLSFIFLALTFLALPPARRTACKAPDMACAPSAQAAPLDAIDMPVFFTRHAHTTVTESRPSYMRLNSFLTLRLTGFGVLRIKVYTSTAASVFTICFQSSGFRLQAKPRLQHASLQCQCPLLRADRNAVQKNRTKKQVCDIWFGGFEKVRRRLPNSQILVQHFSLQSRKKIGGAVFSFQVFADNNTNHKACLQKSSIQEKFRLQSSQRPGQHAAFPLAGLRRVQGGFIDANPFRRACGLKTSPCAAFCPACPARRDYHHRRLGESSQKNGDGRSSIANWTARRAVNRHIQSIHLSP